MELTKQNIHDLAIRIRRDIAVSDAKETAAQLQAYGITPTPALLFHLVWNYPEAVFEHMKRKRPLTTGWSSQHSEEVQVLSDMTLLLENE